MTAKIAHQSRSGLNLKELDSSKEGHLEDLPGNWSPRPWRLSNPTDKKSLNNTAVTASSPCVLASKNLSQQYNQICKTHKRLVKSGVVCCSVSLSDTPPTTLSLPSAPSSPPEGPPRQDSLH